MPEYPEEKKNERKSDGILIEWLCKGVDIDNFREDTITIVRETVGRLKKHRKRLDDVAACFRLSPSLLCAASYLAMTKNRKFPSVTHADQALEDGGEIYWKPFLDHALRAYEETYGTLKPEHRRRFFYKSRYEPQEFFGCVALLLLRAAREEEIFDVKKAGEDERMRVLIRLKEML